MRRMGIVSVVLATSVIVVVADPAVRPAAACSCIESTWAEQLERADVVFSGELIDRIEPDTPLGQLPPAASTALVVFRTERVFKDNAHVTQAVITSGQSAACGSAVTAPGRYLVFGYRREDSEEISINSCAEPIHLGSDPVPIVFSGPPMPDWRAVCAEALGLTPPPGGRCQRRVLDGPHDIVVLGFSDRIDVFCAEYVGAACTRWRESRSLNGWCWVVTEALRQLSEIGADRNCDGWYDSRLPTLTSGSTTPVSSGLPAGARTAVANLTMVDPLGPGYITANRCASMPTGGQQTANGNHDVGPPLSNLAFVPLDADGRFCVFNQSPLELVADLQGHFGPPASGGVRYTAVPARRLLDTRTAPLKYPPGFSMRADPPAGTVRAVVSITVVDAVAPGFVGPCDFAHLRNMAFNTFPRSDAVSNLAIVPVIDGGICMQMSQRGHMVVDVLGFFTEGTGDRFTPAAPTRVLDTRVEPLSRPSAQSITKVQTGVTGASSVAVNVAMVDGAGPGYVTAGLCSDVSPGTQPFATATHLASTVRSNLTIVPVAADGSFCIFNHTAVHLVVDVLGSFGPTGTDDYFPILPVSSRRVLDTRPS